MQQSPENSPVVAITNTSGVSTQTLYTNCVVSSGASFSNTISLQPKQTVLARACDSSSEGVYSPGSIDAGFILSTESKVGMTGQGTAGISISTDGEPGELAAFGFVEHSDSFGDYFSAANFYDPKLLHSSGFVFTGIPVGASHLLPSGSYTPQLALTNFSSVPQVATASFAVTHGESSSLKKVATISLPPNTSRLVTLPNLAGDLDWQNSFVVHTTGQPGDVISKMMFKSQSNLPNIELIGKDEDHLTNAGGHPWSVENGMQSTLVLFNYSDSPKEISVRIASGADVWLTIYTLQPNETRAISVNKILQNRVPDSNHHILSRELRNGELGWWAPSSGAPKVTGRVVQVDAGGTMARNCSCPNVNGLCDITMSLSDLFLTFEDPGGLGGSPTYCEYESLPTGCPNDGLSTPVQATLNWSWSSGNTNIAAITSGATSSTSTWQGMSPGSTTSSVYAHVQSNYQNSCSQSGGVTVVPTVTISGPTSMAATGSIQLIATGSPTGGTYSWSASNSNVKLQNPSTSTVTVSANGVGIIASMQVGPSTTNWNLTPITETVTNGPVSSNQCPSSFGSCPTTNTFYVGQDDAGSNTYYGLPTSATTNIFYDNHAITSNQNLLANARLSSCSISCSQVYTCGGNQIGPTFTITFSANTGTVGSTAVTNITATKTP